MSIELGQQAPAFTLYDSAKKQMSLESFQGKNVLLLFFPFAFSSVCTAELCSVRDSMARYGSLEAEVLGISVDSLYSLAKFKEVEGLNYILLSDFNKDVSSGYGALYETFSYGMKGVSKRAAFVIDSLGKVAYAEVLENASEQPNFGAINTVLESLV